MTLPLLLLLLAGLALLVVGGEFLVRGASRLALAVGVSPLVIGLTVVAYGTSTPELAVSVQAGLGGNDAIAVANVVGSNIFNVLFILGACALLAPLVVSRQLVRVDVPVMIGVSLLAALFAWTGDRIVAWEGALLFAGVVAYTVWSIRQSRAASAAAGDDGSAFAPSAPSATWLGVALGLAALGIAGRALGWFQTVETALVVIGALAFVIGHRAGRGADLTRQAGFILAGLGILVLGARWLVDSSVVLAQNLGVSDAVIGLTIVAAGTSLPEVATSIVATFRGQRDIAIGNVVGSNIYNLLAILGVSALVTPGGLAVAPEMLRIDIPVMIAVALICLPAFYTGYLIRRWEGGLFLAAYLGYTTYLVFNATGHAWTTALGETLGYVFVPVALAAFAVTGFHAWFTRGRRKAASVPVA
jgi:cation:H+ antiporter